MILKIRMQRLTIRASHVCKRIAAWFDKVSHANGPSVKKFTRLNWRRCRKMLIKIAAVGTTITSAVAAVSSSSSITGIALGTASATGGIVATHEKPVKGGYEKIKHVSPKQGSRAMMVNIQPKPATGAKTSTGMKAGSRMAPPKPMMSKRV